MPQPKKPRYSPQVLTESVPRTAKFLNAIGAVPVIRTLMKSAYMKDEHIVEGGQLLLACVGLPPGAKTESDTEEARAQREAVAELNQWDGPHFLRLGAILQRHHPSVGDYVFHELSASEDDSDAVAGVATFLKRIDALENGTDPARADSKKEDKKAIELLGKRGLDKAERARLGALVEKALGPTSALPAVPADAEEQEAARVKALTALKDWYEEWSTAARTVVKKRAYLIRMGLAARRSPRRGGGGGKGGGGGEEG